ncbi:hypothetical protein MMC07_007688 [Pseudocyphellaria aurata]|nr:hypothetical protein [Pseudocyphellaria aurata]
MRPSLFSGAALLLAGGFSVFSRPLSTEQTIREVNRNHPLLIRRDWTNSPLAFLPDLNLLPNTSPLTPPSSPFTGVSDEYSAYRVGSDQNLLPNISPLTTPSSPLTGVNDGLSANQVGSGHNPTNQLGLGITQPDQLGSGGNTLLGAGSPLEIAITIPVTDTRSRLRQLREKPVRYCFFTLLADDSGVEFNECGGDMTTTWDVFADQFPRFRSGFALYYVIKMNSFP